MMVFLPFVHPEDNTYNSGPELTIKTKIRTYTLRRTEVSTLRRTRMEGLKYVPRTVHVTHELGQVGVHRHFGFPFPNSGRLEIGDEGRHLN